MRIMGLDYGAKTVGVALSDTLYLTAQPYETIKRNEENKLRRTLARIEEIVRSQEVSLIILGLPKNMNDTLGDRAEKTMEFQAMVERRTGLAVILWDERLTTIEADEILKESKVKLKDRKKYVDQVAASLILKEYLESREAGG